MTKFRYIALVFGLLLPIIAGAAFLGYGGRFATIETPSMGTYAPVGTVVVTTPVTAQDLHVGQVVLFQPEAAGKTYFHRIKQISHGVLTTRGDLNAAVDPWQVTADQVRGRELLRVPYLGWFVKYVPFLLLGGIALGLYVRLFVRRYQLPVLVTGISAVMAVANLFIKPFVRADMLSQNVNPQGDLVAKFVVTGILPLLARTSHGQSVVAYPGEAARLNLGSAKDAAGTLSLSPLFPNLTLFILIAIAVLGPGLVALVGRASWLGRLTATETVAPSTSPVVVDFTVIEVEPTPRVLFTDDARFDIDGTYRRRMGVPGAYQRAIDKVYAQRIEG